MGAKRVEFGDILTILQQLFGERERASGSLNSLRWTSSKDITCKSAGISKVSASKDKILEFYGMSIHSMGATAMATVCSRSAEIGARSCIFPYTDATGRYLSSTNRADVAKAARVYSTPLLSADEGSQDYYEEIIDVDLDTWEPHVNGLFTPDLVHPLSRLGQAVVEREKTYEH